MAEVEAQPVGRDERARLLHVRAEHLAQRPVQQVRAGVVPTDRVAPLDVDGRDRVLAWLDLALHDARDVAAKTRQRVGGVGHLGEASVGADRARVADLAAALRVERSAVEEDLDDAVVVRGQHREHATFRLALDVAREVGLTELLEQLSVRVGVRVLGARLPRVLAAAALLGHRRIEARGVDVDAALGRDLLGELEREAERVVQAERDIPAEHLRLAQLRDLLVEDREAVAHRLAEVLLLADHDARDEVAVALEVGIRVAHHPDRLIDHRRHHELLAAEQVRVTHRAADDPPEHVATVLVRGEHAVVHEDRARPCVLRHDPEAHVAVLGGAEARARHPLRLVDERHHDVGLPDRVDALQHDEVALEPAPVSMLGFGSGTISPLGSWLYCMKTRFQISG